MNGNSQAVRIPHEFRIDTNEVVISRNSNGDLVIHPVPADRGAALLQALEAFEDHLSAEFVANLERDRDDFDSAQERDPL